MLGNKAGLLPTKYKFINGIMIHLAVEPRQWSETNITQKYDVK